MVFHVPTVCSKCGKEAKPKGGTIRMHLTPVPICEECKPFPAEPILVEVARSDWEALVQFFLAQVETFKTSYNTPGKNDWEAYLAENHPEEYKVYYAAKLAATRKV